MQNKSDAHYIDKVLNGESEAFSVLVERYKTLAYNISLKILKRPEDAEEVTQDAFVKAYRSLRSFRRNSRFSTWLYRIVYNSSITHLRKKQREIPVNNQSSEMLRNPDMIDDDGSQEDEFLAAALKTAVDSLPPAEQTIITLYYYDNSSVEDIAKILSLSVSNVKVKLYRTRKRLHDQIRINMKNEVSA